MKFAISLQRFVPFLGYHHVCMIFLAIAIILISIVLAGCSSYSALTNVYILELSYINTTLSNPSPIAKNLSETLSRFKGSSQLEIRTGYFGLCVRQRGILWLCSSDANGLTQQIGSENDPLNLIGVASKFRDDVLFSGILFMAIVLAFCSFVLLSTFPGWHSERDDATGSDVQVKPFPSRPVSQVALSCAAVAAILALIASLWQHVGSVGAGAMADMANYGNVKTNIGTSAVVLVWTSFTLISLVSFALLTMILSIIVLDRLTD